MRDRLKGLEREGEGERGAERYGKKVREGEKMTEERGSWAKRERVRVGNCRKSESEGDINKERARFTKKFSVGAGLHVIQC